MVKISRVDGVSNEEVLLRSEKKETLPAENNAEQKKIFFRTSRKARLKTILEGAMMGKLLHYTARLEYINHFME